MDVDVPVRCSCGTLQGRLRGVSAARGNRLVCYCDDCQSFAHFLERADEILDGHGGTDIFQTQPARVEIREGADCLACMRLTDKGMLRWYAGCCRTPLGNTPASQGMPFVGVIHSCLDPEQGALGPIRARVQGRFAKGDRASLDASDRAPASFILRFLRMLIGARLRGQHVPTPFFDTAGQPSVVPRVLSAEELAQVEAARDAP